MAFTLQNLHPLFFFRTLARASVSPQTKLLRLFWNQYCILLAVVLFSIVGCFVTRCIFNTATCS